MAGQRGKFARQIKIEVVTAVQLRQCMLVTTRPKEGDIKQDITHGGKLDNDATARRVSRKRRLTLAAGRHQRHTAARRDPPF